MTIAVRDGSHGTHRRLRDGVPFLSAKNITSSGKIVFDDNDERISERDFSLLNRSYALEEGDLLLTIVGTLGRRAIHDGRRITFQRSVAYIRPDPTRVSSGFLFHWFGHPEFQTELRRRSNATAQAGVYLGEVAETLVPDFPLEEQEIITSILGALDRTILATRSLIGKLSLTRGALMHDLLTRGLDEDGSLRPSFVDAPDRYKPSPSGWIPVEWQPSTIGREFEVQLGKMLDSARSRGTSKLYLGNKAVQWDRIDMSEAQRVCLSPAELARFRLQAGDLLVCEGGEVGRAAIWQEEGAECYYQKALHRLRPRNGFHPRILLEFLRVWMSTDALSEYVSKTSIAHLPKEKLEIVPLPVPPSDEQERLVGLMLESKDRVETAQRDFRKLELLRTALANDLLTGRVRVTPLLAAGAEPELEGAG
ncbi:MAG TPA: restriction endonuclease subunit S [Allosphingosinicella sp.]|jgi:type I restriction enzyme S subunit